MQNAYDSLCEHVRHAAVIETIRQLLAWDEQTMMPKLGAKHRAEQATEIATIHHERMTDPRIGEWLEALKGSELAADPHSVSGTNIRRIRKRFERATRVPRDLVRELARTAVLSNSTWIEARSKNDFQAFRPWFERMIGLKRQQAEAIGYEETLYDALLEEFEPGMRTSRVITILSDLRESLVPLIHEIHEKQGPDDKVLHRKYPLDAQRAFAVEMARKIGFSFERGRLDVTTHPFCCAPGPNDVRITTRYSEGFFNEAFFGVLHEAGHGIYDQGLPGDAFGLPAGLAASYGVHESQSRLWENMVGRSRSFWEMAFPRAREVFPQTLGDVDVDTFYAAVNHVTPSFIRVEADEATYGLHILIRFELEQALLSGELTAADAPEAWNAKYTSYLGITPPTDREGILQDMHWSEGEFGYFPSYTIGDLIAAQLFAAANRSIGGLDEQIRSGNFHDLLAWLRENVHTLGQRRSALELVEHVTGEPLSCRPLMDYLRAKLTPIYDL